MGNTPKLTLSEVMERFTPEKYNAFVDRYLVLVQEFHDTTGLPAAPLMLYLASHIAKSDDLSPGRAVQIVVEVMTGQAAQIIADTAEDCAECPDRDICPDAAHKPMVN